MIVDDPQPIHTYFGLTYASYLVLPRSVMQAMPVQWQTQMVKLLEQVEERYGGLYGSNGYDVRLVADTDADTGEAIAFEPDPLANYRYPIPELRKTESE